ncbi:MAG: hypothetical protein P9M14_10125 [Candidatus Alcyoniella australis]|nr:hypothetical protein [Candidatus Alcyoniella australis]
MDKHRLATVLAVAALICAAVAMVNCEADQDDDPQYADDDDQRDCEYLCDEIYDCGLDVSDLSEPECAQDCNLDNSWWRCIKACVDAESCYAASCLEACS